jgi:hypothetical protein
MHRVDDGSSEPQFIPLTDVMSYPFFGSDEESIYVCKITHVGRASLQQLSSSDK